MVVLSVVLLPFLHPGAGYLGRRRLVSGRASSRQHLVTLLCKVRIETEDDSQMQATHDFETNAIDQTQAPASGNQQRMVGRSVSSLIHPERIESRQDIRSERANAGHSNTALKQCNGFEKNVVIGVKIVSVLQQIDPRDLCGRMLIIIRIEYRV